MKLIITIIFAAFPVLAETKPVPQDYPIPMETAVGSFENDVDDTWDKIRRLMGESRLKKYGRELNAAISKHDAVSAQKYLDGMISDFPEIKTKEPHAIEYHQGNINFWKKDFEGAYKEFDKVVKALEQKYAKGIPPGGKYSEVNSAFMGDAYFGRGASLMQMKEYASAAADMDKAISITPYKKAYMHMNKCRALFQLKKYKDAAAALDAGYAINPAVVDKAADREIICGTLLENDCKPKACAKVKL